MTKPKVIYTGVEQKSLTAIQENMALPTHDFIEVPEDQLQDFLLQYQEQSEALLIGENVGNPIRIAQATHALDNQLSIIIINDESSHHKIKHALLFTPFIGNTVQCLSNNIGIGLAAVTQDSIIRTRQRRSYSRMQGAPVKVGPDTHIYENIKAEFQDKFLEGAPIGAILMNQEGLVLAMNQYATQILLKTEKETLGNPFASLFPEHLQEEVNTFIRQNLSQVSIQTFERKLHNNAQYLELRLSHITANESLRYKIGIISDHTDKIVAQQRIEKQLQELAQTNESLKRANTDLDSFVYTASHDLKAPISNIEGLINLVARKVDKNAPQVESIFSMINTCITRFQDTIQDLTNVTLIQKNQEAEASLIDVNPIIKEVKSLIRGMIVSSDAQIIIETDGCPQIRFSRTNFRSIIYNLMSNAIKYHSPERRPLIRISIEKIEDEVLLKVEDNGLGFPADKKEKIFTMFKRLHKHVEGTGMGLFIVKRIVDNSGGRVEVESNPASGTTFSIYLKPEIAAASAS